MTIGVLLGEFRRYIELSSHHMPPQLHCVKAMVHGTSMAYAIRAAVHALT
jgi:hypothetical protein